MRCKHWQLVEKRSGGCRAMYKTVMKSSGTISNSRRLARQGETQGCADYKIVWNDLRAVNEHFEPLSNAARGRPSVSQ
jgi:hypothetical protein